MSLSIDHLSMAIENAIFRNYMERGMRIFTPHMFISEHTGDAKTVLSVLFAMSAAGMLRERLRLRERGTDNVLRTTFDSAGLLQAQVDNPDLLQAEVLYAFELSDEYVKNRLEAEVVELTENVS